MSDGSQVKIDRSVGIDVVRLTEGAARAAAHWVGRGREDALYAAALRGFLDSFAEVSLSARIVMSEGYGGATEVAPGSLLDGSDGMVMDVALKLVECITASALGGRNAMSTIVVAPAGTVRVLPRGVYLEKLACGPDLVAAVEAVGGLASAPADLVAAVASARGVDVSRVTVTVLDRPRNATLIDALRAAGARVRLIADGDLAAAIAVAVPESGIDLLLGSGGALEGWLAAAALRGLGGGFWARFLCTTAEQEQAVIAAGFADPRGMLSMQELLPSAFVFSATGITDGDVLRGIRYRQGVVRSESLMVRTTSQTVRWIASERPLAADKSV